MVLTSSSSPAAPTLAPPLRQQLLGCAAAAIRAGLDGSRLCMRVADYAPALREPRASFVTLHIEDHLRGCIGSLEALRPLVEDVVHNAYGAAFEDPRFTRLCHAEFSALQIHISVLGEPERMPVSSETDLLVQLRPGVDGVVLEDGAHRGTFLPSVWNQLPEPRQFLQHLKRKAGLSEDHWSPTIVVSRYVVEEIC